MKATKRLLKLSEKLLQREIEKTGLPPIEFHKICLEYGKRLAKIYKVDKNLILASLNLMDVKVGQASKEKRMKEHVQMSLKAAMPVIKKAKLSKKDEEKVIGCILSHHGIEKYPSIEAEICANADCFKFLHPRGVVSFLWSLGKRGFSFKDALKYVDYKLKEKHKILSLPEVKKEGEGYYKEFKKLLKRTKSI